MKNWIFIPGVIILSAVAVAQRPDTAFQHIRLNKKGLGEFEVHITKTKDEEKKPLLVYLDGSGNFPMYYRNKEGRTSSSLALRIRNYSKDYIIAVISKPGIPIYDTLRYTESGRAYYPENEQYTQLYSLDWRAETASAAIDYITKNKNVDREHIIVMGYSEGSQVAPRVAVLNKKVTHVVCFVGNALNQLYDFILQARLSAEKGEITPEEGQYIVDSLYTEYAKIYKDPESVSQRWYGATYKKWASFSATTPLENMLKLNIPILYLAGGKDNNQTILDMDYARLEFLRKGKTNLTYKVYPNCDHYFQEQKKSAEKIERVDRLDEVNDFALQWVKSAGTK